MPHVSTHNLQNPEIYISIRNNLPILEEDLDKKKYKATHKQAKVKEKKLLS